MNSRKKSFEKKAVGRKVWRVVFDCQGVRGLRSLIWLSLGVMLVCGVPAIAESQETPY